MKHFMRRGLALGLALLLAAGPAASASEALGHELHSGTVELSRGTGLTKQILWSDTYSDLRTERYFTYSPNDQVTPTVAYGDKVLSRATLADMARSLEAQGKRVVAGVNGDFYVMATGTPVGLVITDGVIRSASPFNYAVGFREDGAAFIGEPNLMVTATFGGQTFPVNGSVNKVRGVERGYYLLTGDFHENTQNLSPGVDVILTPVLDNVGETVNVDLDVTETPETSIESDPGAEEEAPGVTEEDPDAGKEDPGAAEDDPDAGEEDPGAAEDDPGADEEDPGMVESGPGMVPEDAAESTDLTEEITTGGGERMREVKGPLIQSDQLRVGGRLTCTVDQVLESTGSIPIPAGKLVLTINAESDAALVAALRALQPGQTVDIDVTSSDSRWAEAEHALGGLYQLVSNGRALSAPEGNGDAWNERTARTAVGLKADGSVVFYTIDGKQPGHSVGANLTQVSQRLVELGCVEAICLDGGGSTTAGATYPDGAAMEIINKPAEGAQRANSTALFLTTEAEPTGRLSHFLLSPADAVVLAGSTLQVSAQAVDTAYYAMDYDRQVTYSVRNGDGLVTMEGLFTASSESGTTQVVAGSGNASGTASLTVVKTPDRITVSDQNTGAAITALSAEPGEQIDLTATAVYKKMTLTSSDDAYVWTVDPEVGTVDANGLFTAGDKTASGSLTVSAGGAAVALPVNVAGHVMALETFEGNLTSLTSTAAALASAETRLDYVRYGRQSARVDYDAAADGTAGLVSTLAIPAGERYLSLWVYGDGSGNSLIATVADQTGAAAEILLTALDFTGWRHVTAALPENAVSIRSFQLIYGGVEGMAAGTIWLDHLTTSNEQLSDTTPPTVTVTLEGEMVSAVITDNVDRSIPTESVVLTRDGAVLPFTWDQEGGTLTARLPAADGRSHRVTVAAVDASGNLARGSADQTPTVARDPIFTDTSGHWAGAYADYLYDAGITNGVVVGEELQYQPDKNITRGEFFALTARWMGLDLSYYAAVELPFADAAEIPDWCLNEVKALYSLGILKGSGENGALKCNPGATISRAEAVTILGRTQSRGYAEAELTFDDAAQVPAWSATFLRSLVGQGVINGYNNLIQPLNPITRGEVAKILYAML